MQVKKYKALTSFRATRQRVTGIYNLNLTPNQHPDRHQGWPGLVQSIILKAEIHDYGQVFTNMVKINTEFEFVF